MEFPACLTARIASAEGLQAFFVGVAVLNDDRRDALRVRPAVADAIQAARSALIRLPLLVLSQDSPVWSLAVLADGRLARGDFDGNIKLWPKEGTSEPVVLSHGGSVRSLAVLADGRLASGGNDGKIRLWLVDEQQLISALCLRAGRNLTKDEWARYIGSDSPWQPSCRDLPSNWRTPDP